MTVSIYNQTELVRFGASSRKELSKAFLSLDFREALQTIKELKIALASYNKRIPFGTVQLDVLGNIELVTSWCRDAYFRKAMVDVKKDFPTLKKEGLKCKVRAKWESIMAVYRY